LGRWRKTCIDKTAVDDYLRVTGQDALSKNKFVMVELNNIPDKDLMDELENTGFKEDKFDTALLHKKTPQDLNDAELQRVLDYYNNLDLTKYPLKSRKPYYDIIHNLQAEHKKRTQQTELTI